MSLTQFAMVEELACLVKDNIPCKHLILSTEEVLVNFLQDDTGIGGVLELEPMNPYERLLIHRLADIFGFSHHSVGEGEGRHLILERCPETSIPPILVTDLLWQFGEVPSAITFDVPRQKKVIPGQGDAVVSESSLEVRDANYLAARDIKQRPRNDTVVARRMIAHALGKTSREITQESSSSDTKEHACTEKDWKIQQADKGGLCSSNKQNSNSSAVENRGSCTASDAQKPNGSESSSMSGAAQQKNDLLPEKKGGSAELKENSTHKNHLSKEHMGAAKRLFANALGRQQRDINQFNITKKSYG